MTVYELKDRIEKLGFSPDLENSDLISTDEANKSTDTDFELIFSRGEEYITVVAEYTEYYKFLILSEEVSKGEHYPRPGESEFDYSELEIHYIHVSSSGLDIILEDENINKAFINVLRYVENPYSYIKNSLQYFFNEVDKILPIITPTLNAYEFIQTEICIESTDDFVLEWAYKYNNRFMFRISMNNFTKEIWMNYGHRVIYDELEFKSWFINTILTENYYSNYSGKGDSRVALEFERFFSDDKKWTKDSYYEIIKLLNQIRVLKEPGLSNTDTIKINEDIIPDKYQYLLEEYSNLLESSKNNTSNNP